MSVANVNPYQNNIGNELTIYKINTARNNWDSSETLPAGSSITLTSSDVPSNIWNNTLKVLVAVGDPRTPTWNVPTDGGLNGPGLSGVNVIIINNSPSTFTISNNDVSMGQSTILPLTIGNITPQLNGSNTTQIQVLPLPDQLITIGSDNSVSIGSQIGSDIPQVSVTINNCYSSVLAVAERISNGAQQQNFEVMAPNTSETLNVFSCRELFLINGQEGIMSGVYCVPEKQNDIPKTIFFQSTGNVSTESCTGKALSNPGCSTCPREESRGFFERWWWLILIVIIIFIIIIIIIGGTTHHKKKPTTHIIHHPDGRITTISKKD